MKHLLTFAFILCSFAAFSQTLTNQIILDGRDSKGTGTISYLWTQTSGPTTAVISTPTNDTTLVTFKDAGDYTFALKVSDNYGSTDQMFATVTAGLYGAIKAVIRVTKYNILIPPAK
jgi:hypothetical protein